MCTCNAAFSQSCPTCDGTDDQWLDEQIPLPPEPNFEPFGEAA